MAEAAQYMFMLKLKDQDLGMLHDTQKSGLWCCNKVL